MRLHFLGTGGSWPTKRRGPVSIGVRSNGTLVLLDCGEGTQRQLLYSPLSPMKIDAVFITHLHGDHLLGLPGLVQSMSLNGRDRELIIFGPVGLQEAWSHAVLMSPFTQRFDIIVRELSDGGSIELKDLRITCRKGDHSIENLSYRLQEKDRPGRFDRKRAIELGVPEGPLWGKLQRGEDVTIEIEGGARIVTPSDLLGPPRKGRSVVFSGDTRPCDEVVELSKDADVLVHEATFMHDMAEMAEEVGHSTIEGAVSVAKKAGVRKLVLVHSSPRYTRDEDLELYREKALSLFPDIMIPEDLEELEVTR